MVNKDLITSLILKYQNNFPLSERPYMTIAQELNISEEEAHQAFIDMIEEGTITRIGPVFETNKVGRSYLAAIRCPESRIDEVAKVINSYPEVNHNYERENELNLWFVLTGKNEEHLESVKNEIEVRTGLIVYPFEMEKPFKIDLSLKNKGFVKKLC